MLFHQNRNGDSSSACGKESAREQEEAMEDYGTHSLQTEEVEEDRGACM